MNASVSVNENDRTVYFQLDRAVEAHDLEILVLYLESSGGDISKTNTRNMNQLLEVEYEDSDVRKRVLTNARLHKCLKHSLIPFALDDIKNVPTTAHRTQIQNKILLRNINANEEDEVVKLYVNYLQPDNEVAEIKRLRLMSNTLLISFQNDVNFELLRKKLDKRSTLRANQIKFFNVYDGDLWILSKSELNFKLLESLIGSTPSEKYFKFYEAGDFYLFDGSSAAVFDKDPFEKCWNVDSVANGDERVRQMSSADSAVAQGPSLNEQKMPGDLGTSKHVDAVVLEPPNKKQGQVEIAAEPSVGVSKPEQVS